MDVAQLFLDRSRYYLRDEYRTKLRRAVETLPPDALWWRANDASNSVGNLLLHLTGNVRQWIVTGVGRGPESRDRASEFAARYGQPASELLAQLDEAVDEALAVIDLLEPSELLTRRIIQGRDVTVCEAIYHVVEHFAMHMGQVILIAKHHAPGAIKFYEDAGGLARPIWRG
ncbi:MAG: DinB family protein [Gemmatimonadaceae bacterium]